MGQQAKNLRYTDVQLLGFMVHSQNHTAHHTHGNRTYSRSRGIMDSFPWALLVTWSI